MHSRGRCACTSPTLALALALTLALTPTLTLTLTLTPTLTRLGRRSPLSALPWRVCGCEHLWHMPADGCPGQVRCQDGGAGGYH